MMPTLVVLAGGASSRMWPLREKSLLRFGREPLLLMQLRQFATLGFSRVVIVGNPENETVIRELVAGFSDLAATVVVQREANGMGDALLQTEFAIAADSAIYVTQVHDVVERRLHEAMLSAYQSAPTESFLAGVLREDYFPGGYLIVEGDHIRGIIEKPGADKRPSNLVNIVAHIHAHAGRLFDAIRAQYALSDGADDHYERAMDTLMYKHTFRVVPYDGPWKALKFPWHTLDIMDFVLSQIEGQTIADGVYIAPTATVSGNVIIEAGAKLFPGSAVVGPAYIGAGTIIGNNALVRASMVLDRCEVGFTTEIARSYVADHVSMHACRVLDSVFAPHVNFSAGCTTANLRIDRGAVRSTVKGQRMDSGRSKFGAVIGQNAFIGVDVMTMPGVKIGERAQVGPGTHVYEDIANGTRVFVKQELVTIKADS